MDSNDQTQENNLIKKVDELFSDLGAPDLPEEEKGALLARMMDLINARALKRITEKLTDEQLNEFERIMAEDDFDKTEKYLIDNVSDYEQIFLDEAGKLREELKIDLSKQEE